MGDEKTVRRKDLWNARLEGPCLALLYEGI